MMLSDAKTDILKLLAEFKQLTIPQFIRLFDDKYSYQKVYRNLKNLLDRRKSLVARVEYKKVNHFGKLSYVYNITRLGIEVLKDESDYNLTSPVFAPTDPKLTIDYYHRTKTIDFHISLYKHLLITEYSLKYCSHYFIVEKLGKGFISSNKIIYPKDKSIIPDSIYSIGNKIKQRYLLFEFHNGKEKQRILNQIEQHAVALTGLYVHQKYKIPQNKFYYILIVFEERSVMDGVISKMKGDKRYQNVASFFLLKHISALKNDLFSNWCNLKGEVVKIQI